MSKEEVIDKLKIVLGHLELTDERLVVENLPSDVINDYEEELLFIDNEGVIMIIEEIIDEIKDGV